MNSLDGGRGQWLTTSAAAAWLGVSPKTVRRRIERGELEARKASRDGGGLAWLVLVAEQTDGSTPRSKDISTPRSKDISTPRSKDISTPRSKDISTPRSKDISTPSSKDISTPNLNA